jgi:hypothetical protein
MSVLSFITRILEPAGRMESKNRKASDYIASSIAGAFTVKKKDISNNGMRSRVQRFRGSRFNFLSRTAFGTCIYEKSVIFDRPVCVHRTGRPNPKFGAKLAIT